ncbi:CLAVATA3/ESR (CLE)-related protein 25-like [Vigna umbellata]|uniref:CLAVATA3/ESR-like protein n=1 Tax=Vigna angularis var. angularis TaxID=157739 RepID=A0A0S3T3A3_PHAAN|nr:CLAVATA3/ESR (CLE)-related protein 25 [Vigna angularis]XP_047161961.1 CLAVATA3/ESR (CLE)-related protein 25-like [Vigna umbellata]BAT99346.1 hypothetical protein VIGAN_10075700 [Vigna angularis var. angularis]
MATSTRASSSFFLPKFFRALLVGGLLCLLLLVTLGGGEGSRQPATQWSEERVKHGVVVGRDMPVDREELDFNYMSKRRVPNGPDPIHNRRAGNSGRPPGQA